MNKQIVQLAIDLGSMVQLVEMGLIPENKLSLVATIFAACNKQPPQDTACSAEDIINHLEEKYVKKNVSVSQEDIDRVDADRYRKLRSAINHLARLPTEFRDFIAVTAGSNAQGIDEQVDKMLDYRKAYPYV